MQSDLRILEIGGMALMHAAYPDTTHHWSTLPGFRPSREHQRPVTLASLPALSRALASADYDLVVVHPGSFSPWQLQALSRSLFRRSALRGDIPYFRSFGQEMIRGRVTAPIAVWDWDDPAVIDRHNVFLLDAATLYFKRELPPDYWRLFAGTLHRRVPTPRFRAVPRNRQRIAKICPISLGLPLNREDVATARPVPDSDKTADIFFTGRVADSSTVRQQGLIEIMKLKEKGYRVDIPDNSLSLSDYLARCARAWVTWSPEGYGYDCFRTYEAAICGSVPVLNRPTIHRYQPLREGEHCFYYDVEEGDLTRVMEAALADRARLSRMAKAAGDLVRAEHTQAALARYVAETTLAMHRAGGGEARTE